MNGTLHVSVYACDPAKGSEPGAGWQFLKASLHNFDRVVVYTRQVNVAAIRDALDSSDRDRVQLVGVDASSLMLWIKGRLPGGMYLYYWRWQYLAGLEFERRWSREDFAHHVTFAGDWLPTFLATRGQAPFIWGPVGGFAKRYPGLAKYLGFRGRLAEIIRALAVSPIRRLFGANAASKASLVIAQNHDVAEWALRHNVNVAVMPNPIIDGVPNRWRPERSDTIVGVGRLIPWKGWAIVLAALHETHPSVRLEIFGGGPDHKRLRQLVTKLGLDQRVEFRGVVPRQEVLEAMSTARAIVSASLRDSAGWSIAEAVTIGCPVIALNCAGVRTVLEMSGVSGIDPGALDVVAELARAMESPPPSVQTDAWSPANQYERISQLQIGEVVRRRPSQK